MRLAIVPALLMLDRGGRYLGADVALVEAGVRLEDAVAGVGACPGVPGRLERVLAPLGPTGPLAIVARSRTAHLAFLRNLHSALAATAKAQVPDTPAWLLAAFVVLLFFITIAKIGINW